MTIQSSNLSGRLISCFARAGAETARLLKSGGDFVAFAGAIRGCVDVSLYHCLLLSLKSHEIFFDRIVFAFTLSRRIHVGLLFGFAGLDPIGQLTQEVIEFFLLAPVGAFEDAGAHDWQLPVRSQRDEIFRLEWQFTRWFAKVELTEIGQACFGPRQNRAQQIFLSENAIAGKMLGNEFLKLTSVKFLDMVWVRITGYLGMDDPIGRGNDAEFRREIEPA